MKAMKKIGSILPWVLAVIAIIAAVVIFVYADRAEIDHETEKKIAELQESNAALQSIVDEKQSNVDSLQSNVDSLKSTVESLQEKLDSKYSDDEQRWEMEFKAKELEELIDAMPSKDPNAIDIMAKYLFDIGRSLIEYMGDAEFRAHNFVEPEVKVTKNGYTYSKCDISYSGAEGFYSQIFTGNALKNFMSIRFTDIDGDLYAIPGGGSSGHGVKNINLTRVSETKDEIKYKISYAYTLNGGYEDARTCTMTIKLVNGSYRISEIDYMEHYWLNEELYWKARTE